MKVFYFCTRSVVRRICGIMGKGRSCLQIAGCDLLRRYALISTLQCHCFIIKRLILCALFIIALLVVGRIVFICLYVPGEAFMPYMQDVPRALFNALRFDAQVAAYVMALPSLIYAMVMVWTLFCSRAHYGYKIIILQRCYFIFAAVTVTIIEVIDIGFFRNFGTHINVTFFDFFNEGPVGLIIAIAEDYPLGYILLLVVAVGLAAYYVAVRTFSIDIPPVKTKPAGIHITIFLLYLASVFLCMRGSADIYPLQIEDTIVSANEHINSMIPNGVYMLKKAYSDKRKAFVMKSEEELLKEYGFKSIDEALAVYGRNSVHDALFCNAPDTSEIKCKRPNIVLIVAESWSNRLLDIDRQLTGDMRRHLDEDITFRNFQSVCNGTIATIERITVGTPFERVFTSKWRFIPFSTSIALPFNRSGYTTTFMTGMDQAWENCGESLKHQGFGCIIGKYELMNRHPEYKSNHVGVYDHHLLSSILERINEQDGKKPQFILAVTTTNHPPYEMPDDIVFPPLNESIYDKDCWAEPRNVLEKYLRGFQYENMALAKFMTELKQSAAANNTIVMITGDHNVRSIFKYDTAESLRWRNSVPLYIYLPSAIRAQIGPVDINRYGCHYDLTATIAPFAFRNTEYVCLGENMLQPAEFSSQSYSYNEMQVLAPACYKATAERKAAARELLIRMFFWNVFSSE